MASVIADSDMVVVGLSGAAIEDALAVHLRADQKVLDLVNLSNIARIPASVQGLCW